MGIIPMAFYTVLNVMAWTLEKMLNLVGHRVLYS